MWQSHYLLELAEIWGVSPDLYQRKGNSKEACFSLSGRDFLWMGIRGRVVFSLCVCTLRPLWGWRMWEEVSCYAKPVGHPIVLVNEGNFWREKDGFIPSVTKVVWTVLFLSKINLSTLLWMGWNLERKRNVEKIVITP